MLFEEDGQTKGVELTCSFTYVNNSDLFDIIKRLWPSPPLQSVWYQTFLCLATSDVFVKRKGYISVAKSRRIGNIPLIFCRYGCS